MNASQIKVNQEIMVGNEKFRVLRVSELGAYMAKVLKNGKLASPNTGNHGTYTFDQISYNIKIGVMNIL